MFHCTIQEIKPKEFEDIEAMSISSLPKNFNYYAGGHVHVVSKHDLEGYKNVIYPGPTFPNNFAAANNGTPLPKNFGAINRHT